MTSDRVGRFQALMKKENVDAAMIRTLSSFTYFAGVKWLRPSLIIPADGEPVAFIFKHEVEPFTAKSRIKNVVAYGGIDDLIRAVNGAIRASGYRKVGFDVSVERDAYELFFKMFTNLNPQLEIVDIHGAIMSLRMIKDADEISLIRQASWATDAGMAAALDAIEVGASELDIAAEATYAMMRRGAEAPRVYVNSGKHPRNHAEPRADEKVGAGDIVTVTASGDYENYYCNETRTSIMPGASVEKQNALATMKRIRNIVESRLRPGTALNTIEDEIEQVLKQQGYSDNYAKGFAHGVGLLTEEDPITTILMPHRRYVLKENMVLAAVHTPLSMPGMGAIKHEDTFLIKSDRAEQLTVLNRP